MIKVIVFLTLEIALLFSAEFIFGKTSESDKDICVQKPVPGSEFRNPKLEPRNPTANLTSPSHKAERSTLKKIRKAVDEIWLVDTHEHLITEKGRMKNRTGFFYMVKNYNTYDLLSSGMSNEEMDFIYNTEGTIEERWDKFYPFWEKTKNTGYGLCIRATVKGLFGIEDINEKTYKELDDKIQNSNREGWYKYVLKDKARIDVSIIDPLEKYTNIDNDYSGEYYVKVKRFDKFIQAGTKGIAEAQKLTGQKISSLAHYLSAIDTICRQAIHDENIAGIKSALAYERSLYFEDVPYQVAEDLFYQSSILSSKITLEELKKLQDFLMHHIIGLADKYNLPFLIHTGILAGNNNKNPIENTNARLLSNLFHKFPKVRFVIFHGNYPYMGELTYLAKHFPNVYIDMCWMYIISPSASRQYLEEWLFTVPLNKIMAFGGDLGNTVEWVYGHSVMARNIVSEVLTKMVNDGYYTRDEAISIARMILRENALKLYSIKKEGKHFHISKQN